MLDRRVKAGEFSAMNAFFFATLSKLVYRSNNVCRGFMMGDDIQEGLGFTDFHWFEVINHTGLFRGLSRA